MSMVFTDITMNTKNYTESLTFGILGSFGQYHLPKLQRKTVEDSQAQEGLYQLHKTTLRCARKGDHSRACALLYPADRPQYGQQ
jgi:hypothetical protein